MFGGMSSTVYMLRYAALACLWRHCVQYCISFLINYLLSVAAAVSGDVSPHGGGAILSRTWSLFVGLAYFNMATPY